MTPTPAPGTAAIGAVYGVTTLTDSTSSTSTTTAATPNSVKSAYDLAGTAIPKNTLTTTGDILYASGSATVTRLAIGTATQVLSVGTAGIPVWSTPSSGSGGWTALATATPSAATEVEFTGISTAYDHLVVQWQQVYQSVGTASWGVRVNGDTGTAYLTNAMRLDGSPAVNVVKATVFGHAGNASRNVIQAGTASADELVQAYGELWIYRYANTSSQRMMVSQNADNSNSRSSFCRGAYLTTGTAITSITFVRSFTQTINGTFVLYGVS